MPCLGYSVDEKRSLFFAAGMGLLIDLDDRTDCSLTHGGHTMTVKTHHRAGTGLMVDPDG